MSQNLRGVSSNIKTSFTRLYHYFCEKLNYTVAKVTLTFKYFVDPNICQYQGNKEMCNKLSIYMYT